MTASKLTLPDGRVLCVHALGDPTGHPVVFLHGGGLGATGLFAAPCDPIARDLGLRVLAPDRPGLGGSSPAPGRTVLDWAADLAAMADALGLDRFPLVAHSGGAAYALACARRLPDRVTAVALSSAMPSRPLVTHDRALPLRLRLGAWWTAAIPGLALRVMFRQVARGMARAPERTGRAFLRRLPACERPLLATPESQAHLRACVAAALRQGSAGAIADLRLILADWGVPLREVHQPVTLWHGTEDATARPALAQALARRLPAAELRLLPDAGHLTAWLGNIRPILGSLSMARSGPRSRSPASRPPTAAASPAASSTPAPAAPPTSSSLPSSCSARSPPWSRRR